MKEMNASALDDFQPQINSTMIPANPMAGEKSHFEFI